MKGQNTFKGNRNIVEIRCDGEDPGEDDIDVSLIAEQFTKEYEEQLELATETENAMEKKVKSRVGIHDYVSTI